MIIEISLKSRLEAITIHYWEWFDFPSGIQLIPIDSNKCQFDIRIKNSHFSIRLIEKNNKILIISDSFKDEIENKDLETFLHGYIYSTCVIFNQLKL